MSTLESAPARPLAADPIANRVPFFYGWVMLPIAMIAAILTSPGQTYGVSTFNPSLSQSLGLTQSQLAAAYLFGTLLACLPQSFFGAWTDRNGIRRAMTLAALSLGASCLFTSMVNSWFTLLIAFWLLRMFGQGMLSLMASNTLAMWFYTKLGRASAVMSFGAAMSVAIVPRINLWLIEQVGWRWTFAILGFTVWLVMLPLMALLYRDRPEDVGQLPDGRSPKSKPVKDALGDSSLCTDLHDEPDHHFTLGEALRTRAYWIMIGMTVLWSLVGTAIMFHILPLLESRGASATSRGDFYTLFAVSIGAMQIVGGLLADRVRANILFFVAMLGSTVAIIFLISRDAPWAVHAFPLVFGGSQGLFTVVSQTAWARYFGRVHLGRIRGVMWSVAVAASALGPFVMGLVLDLTGEYGPSLMIFAGFYMVMTAASLLATRPIPPSK